MTEQRVAIVTGGNRGIGLEICQGLVARGYHVLLTCRDPALGQAACARIRDEAVAAGHEHRGSVQVIQLDVTSPDSLFRFEANLAAVYGSVQVLINNAGVCLEGWNAQVFRDTLRCNYEGPCSLCEMVLAAMTSRGSGGVVNVSSGDAELVFFSTDLQTAFESVATYPIRPGSKDDFDAAIQRLDNILGAIEADPAAWADAVHGDTPAYRLSKAALNVYTRLLAAYVSGSGVRITAVCPGDVMTRMGPAHATRTPAEGADTVVWAATVDLAQDTIHGHFLRDRVAIPW